MQDTSGLICAYRLDGQGGGSTLDWANLTEALRPERGFVWVHLHRDAPDSQAWLRRASGIGKLAVGAALAEETRPRCTTFEEGTLVNLRGVNLNPGAEPEDMVSVRLWIEARLVSSTHRLRLMAVEDLRATIAQRRGPRNPAEQANRRLYLLSLVPTIFLPLSFITGLFGINVAGMPGINSPHAFLLVCAALVVIAAIEGEREAVDLGSIVTGRPSLSCRIPVRTRSVVALNPSAPCEKMFLVSQSR